MDNGEKITIEMPRATGALKRYERRRRYLEALNTARDTPA